MRHPTKSILADLPANDPNLPGAGNRFEASELFFKMIILVLIVITLGIGGSYLTKKLGKRLAGISGREIQIIETAHLGSRKALHLIRIGRRRLLIGSANDNITVLADLGEASEQEDLSAGEKDRVFQDHLGLG